MIVKGYEKDKFKVAMKAESINSFSIYIINGNKSQIIYTKDMDYESASEIYDFVIESNINGPEDLNVEVKE